MNRDEKNRMLQYAETLLLQADHFILEDYPSVYQAIIQFGNDCHSADYSDSSIDDANFFLCAFFDEKFSWDKPLLATFFQGNTDPENEFYDRLATRRSDPQQHIDLLELAYLCLNLGFRGKYRYHPEDNGITRVMDALYADIRHTRGDSSSKLSDIRRKREENYWRCPPVWVTIVIGIIILFAIYLPYNYRLTQYATPATLTLKHITNKDAGPNEN